MFQRKADKGRISPQEADAAIAQSRMPCTQLVRYRRLRHRRRGRASKTSTSSGAFSPTWKRSLRPSAITRQQHLLPARCRHRRTAVKHPERVAGLHFFNPVPVMKVVEIISAVRTIQCTVDRLKECVETTGHRAVIAQDQPGFLVNHAGRGLYTEGLRILEEQAASHSQVDRLMREAADFRMGPFELLDLTGLDVSGKVMQSIYEQFQQEPRFRPSSLIPPRISAGLYGRKTGAGWYQYEEGKKIDSEPPVPAPLRPDCKVWVDPAADRHAELTALAAEAGAQVVDQPDHASLLLIQPWGIDASQACADLGLDGHRCVAVDPLPTLDTHRTLMLTAITCTAARDDAAAILSADGTSITVINDSPGFVVQRILATIVNIGTNIAQRGIASVADIDDAVTIGLGYPAGPLTLGDSIGGKKVMQILEGLQRVTGDPRYRPSQWLRRRVQLGQSLLTTETARD